MSLENIIEFLGSPINLAGYNFPFSFSNVLLQLVLPVIIVQIIAFILRKTARKLCTFLKYGEEQTASFMRVVGIVLRVILTLVIIILVVALFDDAFLPFARSIFAILNDPFFTTGDLSISIVTIIAAVPVFMLSTWIARRTRKFLDSIILKNIPLDDAIRFTLSNIIGYSTMMLALIIGLSFIGINISSLVLIFGVLGIGIGFGLQSAVANLFSGFIIIFTRIIKVNDYIVINMGNENIEGRIERITLLHSVVNTLLNESIIIPNSDITNKPVHNLSFDSPHITIILKFQVHYKSDIDAIESLIVPIAKKCPYWTKDGKITLIISEFAASGIELGLLLNISQASNRLVTRAWLRREIWRCFRENGIEFPYPQLDVHLPKEDPPKTV